MDNLKNTLSHALPFWNKLKSQEIDYICNNAREMNCKKGTIIHRSDDECKGVMLLLSGQFRVYIVSPEGREVTLYRLRKNDICVLSASCLLDSIIFDVIIESTQDAKTILIPSHVLNQIIQYNPYVELFLYKSAAERFSDVMWTMQQILFMGADKRVAIFLWDETIATGQTKLKYTHDEVAKLIGSAREVVTRILKYFVQEDIITISRGTIEILDKEKLKTFCD